MGSRIIEQLTAGIENCLIVQRVREQQGAYHAAHHIRAMHAGPEQYALQAHDDNAAADGIGKTLQRSLNYLEQKFRQGRRP